MTATAPLSPPADWSQAPAPPGVGETPAEEGPGHLRIDARVVQKLAAQAASEVDGVTHASAGPVSRALHRPLPATTPPDQLTIDLDLTVGVQYPLCLPVVVERLAVHVSWRVERLTGRPVRHVRITVGDLGGGGAAAGPRVR